MHLSFNCGEFRIGRRIVMCRMLTPVISLSRVGTAEQAAKKSECSGSAALQRRVEEPTRSRPLGSGTWSDIANMCVFSGFLEARYLSG
jgi:hypothetical protein